VGIVVLIHEPHESRPARSAAWPLQPLTQCSLPVVGEKNMNSSAPNRAF